MAKSICLNPMVSVMKYSQKTLESLLGEFEVLEWSGFQLSDLKNCNGPVVHKKINGMAVAYNKPAKKIFIENLATHVVNDVAGVLNSIKWEGNNK